MGGMVVVNPGTGGGGSPIPNYDEWLRRFQAPSPDFNVQAQKAPELEALSKRYSDYLTNLEQGTGHAMDVAGQKFRDIREGGAKALAASEGARGIASGTSQEKYAADTARGQQAAIGDVAAERERMMGGALSGAVNAARTPYDLALQEKGLGLNAWQAQQQQNNSMFQNFLALLNAQRQSPIYTGDTGAGGGGGGPMPLGGGRPAPGVMRPAIG